MFFGLDTDMANVICFCCNLDSGIKNDGRIKELAETTKFYPFMMTTAQHEFMCPSCQDKIVPAIKTIKTIVPQDKIRHIYWGSFLFMTSKYEKG